MAASPILTVALSNVAPQDAGDASGVLTTVIQLGLVIGVATLGSVFLTLAAEPGAQSTERAIDITLWLIVVDDRGERRCGDGDGQGPAFETGGRGW